MLLNANNDDAAIGQFEQAVYVPMTLRRSVYFNMPENKGYKLVIQQMNRTE